MVDVHVQFTQVFAVIGRQHYGGVRVDAEVGQLIEPSTGQVVGHQHAGVVTVEHAAYPRRVWYLLRLAGDARCGIGIRAMAVCLLRRVRTAAVAIRAPYGIR